MTTIVSLSLSEHDVLAAMVGDEDGWLRARDLAEALGVTVSSASSWLAWARARGLVERQDWSSRVVLWRLSDEGVRRLREAAA